MSSTTTSTEERALVLLGQGIKSEMVAAALGVTAARISQLISDPEFARKVSELRFSNLSKHSERDNAYDEIEDELLARMKELLPMMYKPHEVLSALVKVNAAIRRGQSAPETILGTKEVVTLTMPVVLMQQFNQNISVNVNNQVVRAGDQELVTVQSVRMNELLARANTPKALTHSPPDTIDTPYIERSNSDVQSSNQNRAETSGASRS